MVDRFLRWRQDLVVTRIRAFYLDRLSFRQCLDPSVTCYLPGMRTEGSIRFWPDD